VHGHEGREVGDDVAGHALRLSRAGVAPTLVRLTSSRAGVPEGDALALAAQVKTVADASDPSGATGLVTFRSSGNVLGSAPLDTAGVAVLDGVHLPVGVHAITASYGGDAGHAAASSLPLPQAVTAAAAPVTVLVSAPIRTPHGVLLEAELVDPRNGRVADDATGVLVFSVGAHTLGSAPLDRGVAQLLVSGDLEGRLRVAFAGDTEHAAAIGTTPLPVAAE
jgi:hypothetical protein